MSKNTYNAVATPQEFLLSIQGMKMVDAEMALIKYIEEIRNDANV